MKKPVKIILMTIAGIIFIALMVTLVWGKTIRMASANKLFAAKDLTNKTKAAKTYEDMAVDEPNSPYVLHNLGLGQYIQGKFDQAAGSLQKALKALEGVKLNPELMKTLVFRFNYHSGNTLLKLAAKSQTNPSGQSGQSGQSAQEQQQQTNFMYQTALQNYRQAIEANPDDLDAKYNYELTQLRIKQQEKQKDQNQQSQDQQDQQNQNQNNQQQSGNQQNQQNQQNQNQQQQENQSKPGEMSKAEAEALLKMAERGEQYQGQINFGAEDPTAKDW